MRTDRRLRTVLLWAFAIGAGMTIAVLDSHAKEVQGTVLSLLVIGFAFGVASPRHAWRWALAIGGGVPALQIAGALFGWSITVQAEPGPYAALLALIPAFVGTYAGVLVRSASSSPTAAADR